MPVISKRFADELNEKEMRDAYLDEKTRAKIALQIRELRSDRALSQAELGQRMNKPQSNIARLEDRDVARYTVTTLLELASAYDCGLVVEFVPYPEFLRRTHDLSPARLRVPSFDRAALEPLCRDMGNVTTAAIGNETALMMTRVAGLQLEGHGAIRRTRVRDTGIAFSGAVTTSPRLIAAGNVAPNNATPAVNDMAVTTRGATPNLSARTGGIAPDLLEALHA
jgi:transcriptional regulator with XRE-family HTH domain